MNYKLVLENEIPVTEQYMQNLFKKKEVLVFGYGSLLYSDGWGHRRMNYTPTKKDLIECKIVGYERGTFGLYSDQDFKFKLHFYGVVQNDKATFNGIVTKIHSLRDWVSLMYTECIAGLTSNYNYRCVDVTNKIHDIKLKENQVVHMVTNEPHNKNIWPSYEPAPGYYKKVAYGVKKERSIDFQHEFFKTGGLTVKQATSLYKSAKI